jgi:hypothetical protein
VTPYHLDVMGRGSDIGDFFDKLVARGTGGRRLDREPSTPRRTVDRIRDTVRDVTTRSRSSRSGSPASPARPGTRERSSSVVVTIEYAPVLDGDPDPGEVVWTWVPYEEDPSQGKDRPVVVIGRRGDSLVGIPLTTKRHDEEAQVEVGTGAWDGERRVSYARIWRLLVVDPSRMRREGAVLERDRFDRVIEAVDDYYDVRRTTTGSGAPAASRRDPDH